MKTHKTYLAPVFFVIIIMMGLNSFHPAYGDLLYKDYIIRYDRGWDILCDPYVVQKDDWIYKLFRERGEISHTDYPEFLRIFKRLNPHLQDIDRIRPGQHIVIPLRKISRDTLSEPSANVVTIPFLIDSNPVEMLKKYSSPYRIQKDDFISVLISRKFKGHGANAFKQGIKLFRMINPRITNLNRIYVGQMVRIPDPAIQSEPWYGDLLNTTVTASKKTIVKRSMVSEKKPPISSFKKKEKPSHSVFSKVASALEAKLQNKGVYYVPGPGQKDLKIDLSQSPLMEFKDGTRMMFFMADQNIAFEERSVKSYWKGIHVIKIKPEDSVEQVFDAIFNSFDAYALKDRLSFSDHGLEVEVRGKWIVDALEAEENKRSICITLIDRQEERTPPSMVHYLDQHNIAAKDVFRGEYTIKGTTEASINPNADRNVHIIDVSDHKAFVRDLLAIMDFRYTPDKSITFPYAGIQVNAASNLAENSNGDAFWIDFGDFYGDAVHAIEAAGDRIIQIKENDRIENIIEKLLGAMNVSFAKHPNFLAAKRSAAYNISLTIQGFSIDDAQTPETLLAFGSLNDRLVQFFTDQGIKIIMVKSQGKQDE